MAKGWSGIDPPTSAGAIVMAVGIFYVAALPRLPVAASLRAPVAVAIVLIWLATAIVLTTSIWRVGGLARRTEPVIDSFGIGTWVAGTAVLARVLMLIAPDDPWPARIAFLASAGLWLWFMPRAVGNLIRLARARLRPSGIILLSTVATQAIALIGLRLFPTATLVRQASGMLIALGICCYALSAFVVVRGYAVGNWRLATDWANGNCILHGALSITGLAVVVSGLSEGSVILVYWAAVIVVFALVEAVEIARVVVRIGTLGWRRAVFSYDVSQWARNFTFGMFYAFTVAFAQRYPIAGNAGLEALRNFVLAYGAQTVLFFLLAETAVMLVGTRQAEE